MISEKHVEALTIAMAIAPGVYARNRMFDLFTLPGVQRAKTRAAIIRGIVPHLARATALSVTSEGGRDSRGEPVWVLRYAIAELRLTRVVELSTSELSAVRVLASRANIHALPVEANDRTLVDAALARLLELQSGPAGVGGGSTRAPSPSWPPPPPRFPA